MASACVLTSGWCDAVLLHPMALRVKNWKKFQHFKDRRPPWIKLYRDLLDDKEWHRLDAESAKVLVMLWLIASEDFGNLPDVETLAFRLRKSDSDVQTAIDCLAHWLEHADITERDKPSSPRYQDDAPETETETETETEGDTAAVASARPRRSKKSPMPDDFDVSERVKVWAAKQGYGRLPEHLDAFKRKAQANGYTYADWDSAFMEAIREDWAKLRGRAPNGAAPPPDVQAPSGPDPALEKLKADALKAVPPPGHVRDALRELSTKFKGAMQ